MLEFNMTVNTRFLTGVLTEIEGLIANIVEAEYKKGMAAASLERMRSMLPLLERARLVGCEFYGEALRWTEEKDLQGKKEAFCAGIRKMSVKTAATDVQALVDMLKEPFACEPDATDAVSTLSGKLANWMCTNVLGAELIDAAHLGYLEWMSSPQK
eukprot:6492672-Amphidinium_carterae.1